MFVITVEFGIKPERVNDFMALMKENAEASLTKEPGCHQFDICVDPNDSTKIFLYELYTDKKAFETHKQTEHFKKFDKATAEMITHKGATALQRSWPTK